MYGYSSFTTETAEKTRGFWAPQRVPSDSFGFPNTKNLIFVDRNSAADLSIYRNMMRSSKVVCIRGQQPNASIFTVVSVLLTSVHIWGGGVTICMYIYICNYVRIYTHTNADAYVSVCLSLALYGCISAWKTCTLHSHACVCVCTCVYVCVYILICTCKMHIFQHEHIPMWLCVCLFVIIYIYIYTYAVNLVS